MLKPVEFLELITSLNDKTESGIDGMSCIMPLSMETDGKNTHIKLGGSLYGLMRKKKSIL